jgi:hypothetical protein
MDKEELKTRNHLFSINPEELGSFEEWAEYLESILHDRCSIMEIDGELVLLEIKALIARVNGLKIEIFSKEHAPPHFHVKSANVDASFKIEDCSLLQGEISGMDYSKIRYWHKHSKQILIEAWNSSRPTNCMVGLYKST